MNVFNMHTMPNNYSPLAKGWRGFMEACFIYRNISDSSSETDKNIRQDNGPKLRHIKKHVKSYKIKGFWT